MNLYQRFTSSNDIFYYRNITANPIINQRESWTFIEEYFRLGGKEKAFDLKWFKNLKEDGKHIHAISMYFLGCILQDIIKNNLDIEMANFIPGEKDFNKDFLYLWFLTCLYHDTAYVIENDKLSINFANSSDYLKYYLNDNKIKHDVYSRKWLGKSHYTYERELIENYFNYRIEKWKCVDHGIIGGFLFYDRLYENYNNAWNKYRKNNEDNNITKDRFEYKGLIWDKQQLDVFAYISNAIIAHNVYYSDNDKLYNKYGLKKLIKSNDNKIILKSDPLLYFLSIVDTIEPTKFFDNKTPEDIWKNIDMYFDYSLNCITIKSLSDEFYTKEWENKIVSLKDWLAIDVTPESNRTIYIKIT